MAFQDTYRLSSHAVFVNEDGRILQLNSTYGDKRWGLPGGALEPGETIHEAVLRECKEELDLGITVDYLSGVYYHSTFNSHAFIFRCRLPKNQTIRLSSEHSDYAYFSLDELSEVQRQRVEDCLEFSKVRSAKF